MTAFKRIVAMAASALFCACSAGFVALYVHSRLLSPSDGAYGKPASQLLGDPFVLAVWWRLVAVGTCIGFALSALLLWRVKLSRAIPAVTLVTVAAVAASAAVFAPLSPLVGLASAIVTMRWCHGRPGWQLDPSA